MDDKPVEGLRRKKTAHFGGNGFGQAGDADAIISPGNTGGMVAAASIKLRTLPGVDRPGIAAVCPRMMGTSFCSTPVRVWTANPDTSCTTPSWATFSRGRYWVSLDREWAF